MQDKKQHAFECYGPDDIKYQVHGCERDIMKRIKTRGPKSSQKSKPVECRPIPFAQL